jgi:hypothetical protein
MKIEGNGEPRTRNPSDPMNETIPSEKKQVYLVDLDGTLAYYERWGEKGEIGEPIPLMKKRVIEWINEGIEIRIFTARAFDINQVKSIKKWLMLNGFPPLEITNVKGIDVDYLFDNIAREVINNTGIIVDRIGDLSKGNK